MEISQLQNALLVYGDWLTNQLILFENLFKPRQLPSATSKHCFEQPAARFLVCSLIFIEYKTHKKCPQARFLFLACRHFFYYQYLTLVFPKVHSILKICRNLNILRISRFSLLTLRLYLDYTLNAFMAPVS